MTKTMRNNTHLYKIAGTAMSLLGFILILIPLVGSLFLIVPRIIGISEYTVITPSMEPTIPVGSIVLVKPIEFDEIKEGDIISYYSKNHSDVVVTHRVASIDADSGKLITKGDANNSADVNPVSKEQMIGIVIYSLPKAGIYLQNVVSVQGLLLILAMFISGSLLTSVGERLVKDTKKHKEKE